MTLPFLWLQRLLSAMVKMVSFVRLFWVKEDSYTPSMQQLVM